MVQHLVAGGPLKRGDAVPCSSRFLRGAGVFVVPTLSAKYAERMGHPCYASISRSPYPVNTQPLVHGAAY